MQAMDLHWLQFLEIPSISSEMLRNREKLNLVDNEQGYIFQTFGFSWNMKMP